MGNIPYHLLAKIFMMKTCLNIFSAAMRYIGIWESEEAIAAQRDAMIANLDKMRHVLEELSPELGVTDPVSGTVVLDYEG